MRDPALKKRLRLRRAAFCACAFTLAALAVWAFSLRWRGGDGQEPKISPAPGEAAARFGNTFALCSSTKLRIFGESGELLTELDFAAEKPALAASAGALAAWDMGGGSVLVLDAEGNSRRLEAGAPLFDAAVNENALALLSGAETEDCLGCVTLYGAELEKTLAWYAGTAMPVALELAPDGESFFVLCLAEEGAQLRCIAAADGAELWRYESPAPLFDLAVLGGEAVCAVGTEKTVVLDLSGAELQTWEHASELSAWELSDNAAVLRFGETRVVLDAGGAEVYNE